MKVTLLKKGEGDLQALKHDIKDALQLKETEVSVNSITKHIVVKVSVRWLWGRGWGRGSCISGENGIEIY